MKDNITHQQKYTPNTTENTHRIFIPHCPMTSSIISSPISASKYNIPPSIRTTNTHTNFVPINLHTSHPNRQYHRLISPQIHQQVAEVDYKKDPNYKKVCNQQLAQLKQQLCSIKKNIQKLTQEIQLKQHIKKNSVAFSNTIEAEQHHELLHKSSVQMNSSTKSHLLLADKINYIFRKLTELDYKVQNKKQYDYEPTRNVFKNITNSSTPDLFTKLIECLKEKTYQLKRIQIKHLANFMEIDSKEQNQALTFRNQYLPQQWKTFEKILNQIIYKFQIIIQTKNNKSQHKKQKSKTKSNQQSNLQTNNEIKKLMEENKLKTQEISVLKLQYSKLKNKILMNDQEEEKLQQQLQQYKNLNQEYIQQIQRLEELIQRQNQKIEIMNSIHQKKQDVEKQFHRIFQQFNKRNLEKDEVINDLKKKLSEKESKQKDNIKTQKQLRSYINRIQYKYQQMSQQLTINSLKQNYQNKSNVSIEDHLNQNNNRIVQLILYLRQLLYLPIQKDQSPEIILRQIVENFERFNYIEIYENYCQLLQMFNVNIKNPNHLIYLLQQINSTRAQPLNYAQAGDINKEVEYEFNKLGSNN